LNEFTIATIENAIDHKLKITPTDANSSLLIPLLEINNKYQRRKITEKIIPRIDIAFILIVFS
jgi:hypothetical protein